MPTEGGALPPGGSRITAKRHASRGEGLQSRIACCVPSISGGAMLPPRQPVYADLRLVRRA
jgi:hypothetical protein